MLASDRLDQTTYYESTSLDNQDNQELEANIFEFV